jgi:hypothetical protein
LIAFWSYPAGVLGINGCKGLLTEVGGRAIFIASSVVTGCVLVLDINHCLSSYPSLNDMLPDDN